jgi:hypothetical protein
MCNLLTVLANDEPVFGLKLLQTHLTLDQNKFHHIIGIAQNDMNMTLDDIFVKATILGDDNTT